METGVGRSGLHLRVWGMFGEQRRRALQDGISLVDAIVLAQARLHTLRVSASRYPLESGPSTGRSTG